MLCYYISDGASRPELLLDRALRLIASRSVDWIQIREKTLPSKALFDLTVAMVAMAKPAGVRVLVNERADIALAAGADGVHLPSHSIPPARWRRGLALTHPFLIGMSCHNLDELREAAQPGGADFAVLSPVFAPLSKSSDLPPLGLTGLEQLVRAVPGFPVLALGGITWSNAAACVAAGACGVAGISLFADP